MSINVICCPYFSGSKMGGSDNDIIFVSAQPTSWLLGFELSLRQHHRVLSWRKDMTLQCFTTFDLRIALGVTPWSQKFYRSIFFLNFETFSIQNKT